MTTRTWIVIVNYRTAGLVVDCLHSLLPQVPALGGGRVLVVDNASADGSVETLSEAIQAHGWLSWVTLEPLAKNGGFAYGNNAAIAMALAAADVPDYILLLNPDTVVRPGAIEALSGFMDAHPRAGIAGSRLLNGEGGVDCSAHRFHSPLSELDDGARLGLLTRLLSRYAVSSGPRAEAYQCDWVSGASLMLRRHVIEQVGPMDDGYFLYFEEVDFCWRVKRAGWEIWYAPSSQVVHLEGAATGIRIAAKRRPCYWFESRRRFFIKHYGVGGLVVADLLWAAGRASFLLRRLLRLGGRYSGLHDPKWLTLDLLWGDLRSLLDGRGWRIARAGERP